MLLAVYYIQNAQVTAEDASRARKSWELISKDSGKKFSSLKGTEGFMHLSALSWFYEAFYARLFDVHPACRPLFKGNMQVQGKALMHMIGGALSLLDNLSELVGALQKLAKGHNTKGVSAVQYGIVGEVLLWTFDQVLGPEFDEATKLSWVKIYSVMLSVIIPVAIKEEMKSLEAKIIGERTRSSSSRVAVTADTNTDASEGS